MNETALQAQIRVTREKAEKAFATAESDWLKAEELYEADAKKLRSYHVAKALFSTREVRRLDLNRALEAEDQVNGTSYAPKNEVMA